MNTEYWFNIDGKQVPNEEAMLSKLLDECYLFCNSRVFLNEDGTRGEETIVLYILCNDVFAPAADAESLTLSELPTLFSLFESKDSYGVIEFVSLRRKLQPRKRVKERMIKAGFWTEQLESLEQNLT